MLERCAVFYDDLPNSRMIVSQQHHHVFRVRGFGKTCKASQVTKERSNLASVTLELLLHPRCNNQISDLWRKEAPQLSHTLDFAELIGHSLFQSFVPGGKLSGLRGKVSRLRRHLIMQPFAFQRCTHARSEKSGLEWFWQVVLGAKFDAANNAVELTDRRDHDDWNIAQPRTGSYALQHFVSVQVRHHDV